MTNWYCYNHDCPHFQEKGYVYGGNGVIFNSPNKIREMNIVKTNRKCPHCKQRMTDVTDINSE